MMGKKYDWSTYPEVGMYDFTPEEVAYWPEQIVHPAWKIPEKICIQCALSGGGARLTPKQNPNHPGANLDNIQDSADELLALDVGPTVVHFDNDFPSCQTRAGKTLEPGDSYMYMVPDLMEKYGREKLLPHINCLRGTLESQMKPVVSGLAEMTYTHPRASRAWSETCIPIYRENGVKAEIVIHVNSEIDLAQRNFLKTGLMPNPNLWILLFGLPCKGPRWHFEYIPNEKAMCQTLVNNVERIRELDPEGIITVCCAGRPSKYLVTLAILLGLNIRMGHEDTIFQYPHKEDLIVSNASETTWAINMAKALGRDVMTPNEFREQIGLKPRHDFLPKGVEDYISDDVKDAKRK
jgi:uncharacterized protein (DUF849 family)